MTTTITMTKRGAMTGYLSRTGVVTAVTLAVAMAAVAAPLLSPTAARAQVRMTVPPQSEPVALRGATIHTVTNGVIENGTILFENGVSYAQYDSVHDGSSAYHAWSNDILSNGSLSYGINCGPGTAYEFLMTDGDLADIQLCNTNLYMHVADHDGNSNSCANDDEAWGPAWSTTNNDNCPLDDPNGSSFVGYRTTQHPWGTANPLRMWVR